MRRLRLLLELLILWPASALAQTPALAQPALPAPLGPLVAARQSAAAANQARPNRFQDFLDAAILSPTPYVLAGGGGVLDQLGSMPEEWTGGGGFARRYLARLGMGFTSDAVGHSAAAVLHTRVQYDPCTCHGGWQRTRHAMSAAFVSVHADGHRVPNASLWIGKYSAAGLANTWYPASYQKNDIIREGTVGIFVSGGLNILSEFSPELLRIVGIR